jgi:hypothetical protein
MTPLMTALPEHSNDGYVAAAYIVFFALLLIYLVIMAIRLSRVERAVRELRAETRTVRPYEHLQADTQGVQGGRAARARDLA